MGSGVEISPHDVVVTKHHADAAESAAYRDAIEQAIGNGINRIVVVGFQFTTCVAASAVSTLEMVRGRGVGVTVVEAFTGSRASSYVPGTVRRISHRINTTASRDLRRRGDR